MERNKRLAELLRIKFTAGYRSFDYRTSGEWIPDDPDFSADPRLVLREMRKREDWVGFVKTAGIQGYSFSDAKENAFVKVGKK